MLHNIFNRHMNMSENNSNRQNMPNISNRHNKTSQTDNNIPTASSTNNYIPTVSSTHNMPYSISTNTSAYPLQHLQKIYQHGPYIISNRHNMPYSISNMPLTVSPKNTSIYALLHPQ